MDNLLVLAGELVENNNFKTDDFQEETKPDGVYETIIESIKAKVSEEKGTEWFAFSLKVTDGDYIEEKFNVNLFLTEKSIKITLKKIMRLLTALGYEIDITMFSDKDSIVEGLQSVVGETTFLSKTTSKNGFINYDFIEGGQ